MIAEENTEGKGIGQPPPRRKLPSRRLLILIGIFLLAGVTGAAAGYLLTTDIPEVTRLENWKPPVVTVLYADDGSPAYQFGGEKRILVDLKGIPPHFIEAIIATEDTRFYRHFGVDPWGTARALFTDVTHLKKKEGGSTLTQQLAKMLFLKPDKTFRRKIQEAILAMQIEKAYTKQEILVYYCNQIYLAHGRYGVETASRFYFGKPAREMTLSQAALLAGMVQRPEAYSPLRNRKLAIARRNRVLDRMVEERYLTKEQADAAKSESFEPIQPREESEMAPYFVEEVRRYLDRVYGEATLYQEGLEVYTTLDPVLQKAANEAISRGLRAVDKRQGFRPIRENVFRDKKATEESYKHPDWVRQPGPGSLIHGLVTRVDRKTATVRFGEYQASLGPEQIKWTRAASPASILHPGDVTLFAVEQVDRVNKRLLVSLDQDPLVEGALVALEPATGEVKALVGGYDFERSEFDRAIQSLRQPGSAFKPFVYLAALDSGYTLADILFDEPTVFLDSRTNVEYQPENYTRQYYGGMTLRTALEESRNIVSVKLINQVGYRKTIDLAAKMGVGSRLSPYPSLALGSSEVSLWDMVSAYSVLPNQGIRVEPHMIRKVMDREGKQREEAHPQVQEVLKPDIAYLMAYALEGVTETGTGSAARVLNRPIGGKTGTTDDLADAWFVGFTPSLAVGVWVGFDQRKSLGVDETGAHVALPIWIDFMKNALKDRPVEKFARPSSISFVPVDRKTGLKASVESDCQPIILEAFLRGTEPTAQCSEAEHFRISLPYYLQRYQFNRRQELRIDADGLRRLLQQGSGELSLSEDRKSLVLHQESGERIIPLDIGRRDLRELTESLEGGTEGSEAGEESSTGTTGPPRVGKDGREATLILIKYD
jgi:penicillin-binding protein 1A